jgi:homotetrameric cytidine deaminase
VNAEISPDILIEKARECLSNAYAPYSGFPVGAAVVDNYGRIFSGANVENASYGLTICAERVAIFSAIAAGATRIKAIAVTAEKLKPVTPCGACRQIMAEFCEAGTPVFLEAGRGEILQRSVGELLPEAFALKKVL